MKKSSLNKIKKFYLIPILIFCLIVFLFWPYSQRKERLSIATREPLATLVIDTVSNEPIQPIPLKLELNQNKVKLGEKLFNEPKLSSTNKMSCVSCHNLNTGGTDRLAHSIGMSGTANSVNSPTVFNSGFHFKQNWDGRAETLEAQIDSILISNAVMGNSDWSKIVSKLKQNSDYISWFKQLYTDGINSDNIKDALATFERSLYTPNSRFDQFLRGDEKALTQEEKEGYSYFKAYGCVSCHQGMLLGGNMFQKFGLLGDYFGDRGNVNKEDFGRFNVTGDERDRYVFKVPSLRNVLLTSPYFHDGSAKTLEDAIKVMAKYQLGRQIPQEDIDLIIKFLSTLTGKYKGESL